MKKKRAAALFFFMSLENKMSFSAEELGSFLTRYTTMGDTVKIDTHALEDSQLVGHGEVYFPNRSLEFSVFVVTDPHITDTICMTEVDDFGGFEIAIHYNHVFPLPDAKIYKKTLEVASMRQLVRLAIAEMPAEYKDVSHSTLGLGQLYKAFPALIDYQPELQAFFRNQFIDTNNPSYKNSYFNTIATALLNDGVSIREYEVDLETLRFFNPDDLCFLHWLCVRSEKNQAVIREVKNRTQRLLTRAEYNGEVWHPEFEVQLQIY